MTTHSYSAVIEHASDAGFRAWGSGLSAGLITAGLVQTADTGQINWLTVTRPAANGVGGYEIFRLASSTLYFKVEYGTNNGPANPQVIITVGTGSNGSGTLTGQLCTRMSTASANIAVSSTVIAYTTYISVLSGGNVEGLTLVFGMNAANGASPVGFCAVHRSVDINGVVTNVGYKIIAPANGSLPSGQDVRTLSPAATFTHTIYYGLASGSPASGVLNSGDNAVWLHWSDFKDGMQPHIGTCGYVAAEWAETTTKVLTLFGSTPHTYFAVGLLNGGGSLNGGNGGYGLAAIYE